MSLKRTMTVARLTDGRLVIHNGIAIADIQLRQLGALGTPAFLIVPNGFHREDAAADVMFDMDRKRDLLGFLFTTILGSAPGRRVSRLAKLVLIEDQAALRRDFERYAALPDLRRLIVAHENVASGADARDALLAAARYL